MAVWEPLATAALKRSCAFIVQETNSSKVWVMTVRVSSRCGTILKSISVTMPRRPTASCTQGHISAVFFCMHAHVKRCAEVGRGMQHCMHCTFGSMQIFRPLHQTMSWMPYHAGKIIRTVLRLTHDFVQHSIGGAKGNFYQNDRR